MNVIEIDFSPKTEFMEDYIGGRVGGDGFLDYTYNDRDKFKKRIKELATRSYQRGELAAYFSDVHKDLAYNEYAHMQIDKLKKQNSVVVVGGQQAGLLTGPLYTVYKAMSIITLAKQQEEELKIPVVPIFWIAGEDHDLDEIRYVYKEKAGQWKKHMFNEKSDSSSSSKVKLDRNELNTWVEKVFASLPETEYTNSLLIETERFANESASYVDFFVKMMNWFFGKEGLLLLDSHAPAIRNLEVSYFEKIINEVEEIQLAQQTGVEMFSQAGYGQPIETDATNSHLFLEINEQRRRLDYIDHSFIVNDSDHSFTKKELVQLLYDHPERFSNNVVTRPLMQEWLLPVLAFISGPGELLYWATLQGVFHQFKLYIPPIVPRYEATFIPVAIGKWLKESNYEPGPFLEGKMIELRESWLKEATEYPINEVISEARKSIDQNHLAVRELASNMDPTLAILSEKNALFIDSQLKFLEKKMERFVRQSHDHILSKFTETGRWLFPLNRPQERVIHPLVLLNMIGIDEFQRFMSRNVSLDPGHKIIYL